MLIVGWIDFTQGLDPSMQRDTPGAFPSTSMPSTNTEANDLSSSSAVIITILSNGTIDLACSTNAVSTS